MAEKEEEEGAAAAAAAASAAAHVGGLADGQLGHGPDAGLGGRQRHAVLVLQRRGRQLFPRPHHPASSLVFVF